MRSATAPSRSRPDSDPPGAAGPVADVGQSGSFASLLEQPAAPTDRQAGHDAEAGRKDAERKLATGHTGDQTSADSAVTSYLGFAPLAPPRLDSDAARGPSRSDAASSSTSAGPVLPSVTSALEPRHFSTASSANEDGSGLAKAASAAFEGASQLAETGEVPRAPASGTAESLGTVTEESPASSSPLVTTSGSSLSALPDPPLRVAPLPFAPGPFPSAGSGEPEHHASAPVQPKASGPRESVGGSPPAKDSTGIGGTGSSPTEAAVGTEVARSALARAQGRGVPAAPGQASASAAPVLVSPSAPELHPAQGAPSSAGAPSNGPVAAAHRRYEPGQAFALMDPVAGPVAPTPSSAAPSPSGSEQPAGAPTSELAASVSRLVAAGDGNHSVRVDLHPPELGHVQATVTVHGDDVRVLVSAANPAGHEALARHLGELRQALDDTGAGKLSLSLAPEPGGGGQSGSGRPSAEGTSMGGAPTLGNGDDAASGPLAAANASAGGGRHDIHVIL
ncbi:MAG: Collagen alpha-2(I) chain [Acidimicrobiaceae bacterium]|nr:Collagen alpha-2(I) chain [Acidimicrobiaceae bacterium]